MENENSADLIEEEENVESSKPRWWKPFWILTAISMVGSGVFTYFFLHSDIVRIIIYEIIFSIALGIAYYIRIKPSKRVKKLFTYYWESLQLDLVCVYFMDSQV